MRVDWWPSTGRTVIYKNYKDAFLSQDVKQLIELIKNNTQNEAE